MFENSDNLIPSDSGSSECYMEYAGGKIEKNEMGGACGAYEGGERCAQGFGGEA